MPPCNVLAASLQPNSTLLAASLWHPCSLPASLLQPPYAFCGPNNTTTLEFNSLFGTIYNPCSLIGASVQSPQGGFGPNNATTFEIDSLLLPCSLLAASLRPPCGIPAAPLCTSWLKKARQPLKLTRLFRSNVSSWSLRAASLCTSWLKVRQPLKLMRLLATMCLLGASSQPPYALPWFVTFLGRATVGDSFLVEAKGMLMYLFHLS